MKILLDTHVFLWAIGTSTKLSAGTIEMLGNKSTEVFLSVASFWEIALKYAKGNLILPDPPKVFVPRAIAAASIKSLPIVLRETILIGELPLHHRDPFDRMIITQAKVHKLIIVTGDQLFDKYDVETIRP